MKPIINFNSSITLRVIFVLAVFALLFISSVSYKHNNDLNESSQLVIHTHEINLQLERLISFIKDAETGQHGYIITKKESFLLPFLNSHNKVNTSFIELRKLTLDNPVQQKNLNYLSELIEKRFSCFEQTLKYSNVKTYDKEKLDGYLLRGRILMENIRFQIEKMKYIEKQFLEDRQKKYENEISITPIITISVFLVALSLIILSYRQINNDMERLKVYNKKLLISTRLMSEAEKIGSFSTWQWDLDTSKITYSDNHYRLLGFEPNAFIPAKETFTQFVHPDDQEAVANSMQEITEKNILPFIYYKIIRQDGSVRHFKSIGKLLLDKEGGKIILGISFDITEEHNQNIALFERNKELEKSNQELASFNHVASHDLQEPLRKILTFISLISETDKAIMSDKCQLYLTKIETSAKRMRVLIDDLLLFSRTNTTKKEFLKTNLNDLLDNAKSELAETIEEKKAIITSSKLPKIEVIPYQIEQLFINLIGNSLKYSQKNVTPVIDINCEKIDSKMFPDILEQSVKKHYKITFTDNGMGFDPQFKTSIFILFKRLHSKTDYPGTGIGLAICKKIVENHKGYILADSIPDKGSVFTVFLPA